MAHRARVVGALVVIVLAGAFAGLAGSGEKPAPGSVPWSKLSFSASKFLLSASTTIEVQPSSVEALVDLDVDTDGGMPLQAASGQVVKVIVDTDLPFGRSEVAEAFVDPMGGGVLQLEKNVGGGKPYWKRYRFTDFGCFEWRSAPEHKHERDWGPERWTRKQERWYIWAPKPSQGEIVTDGYALLYLVSTARLDRPEAALEVVVPSGEQLVDIEFVSRGMVETRVNFEQVTGDSTVRRKGRLKLRLVHGNARYLGTDDLAEDVDTGFMGMQGALEILVEEGTGIPVEVSGRSKGIGRLVVRLDRVVMAR